jgi:hypothetical protein
MRVFLIGLAAQAALATGVEQVLAWGQRSCAPAPPAYIHCGPCGGGWTVPPPEPVYPWGWGYPYGPGIMVRPPFPPFQGILPVPDRRPQVVGCALPQHPYARSPRDYFMYYDRDNNGTRP